MHTQNYIGIDTHESQNTIALFHIEQDNVSQHMMTSKIQIGSIPNDSAKLKSKLTHIEKQFGPITSVGYETGFSGYNLYRKLTSWGYDTSVLAPHTIPKKPGKNKNDKIDASDIAEALFTQTATSVKVPTLDQERDRALVRRRIMIVRRIARIKTLISHFMKIHNITYTQTKGRWTKTFYKWLFSFEHEDKRVQLLLEDLISELILYETQLKKYEELIENLSSQPEYSKAVFVLTCLKGMGIFSAMVWITEVVDIKRFSHAKSLMSYVGNTPLEKISDGKGYKGRITKHGNTYLRNIANASAWHYQYRTRPSKQKQDQYQNLSLRYQIEIDNAHQFLHKKFRHLDQRGLPRGKVAVAIGRYLTGFIWNLMTMVNDNIK